MHITYRGARYQLAPPADWQAQARAATLQAAAVSSAVGSTVMPGDLLGLVRAALGDEQFAAFKASAPTAADLDSVATQILTSSLPRQLRRRVARAKAKGARR